MRRNGLKCIGRPLNRLVNVLVAISPKDWLLKVSYRIVSAVEQGLTFMYRIDSMIMTLMSYSISSGLLTR